MLITIPSEPFIVIDVVPAVTLVTPAIDAPPAETVNPLAEVIVPVPVVDILPDVVILPEAVMAAAVMVPVNVGLAVGAYPVNPVNPVTVAPFNANV